MTDFKHYDDKTLMITQDNLLRGLNLVAKSLSDGSFNVVGVKGSAPPSQAGHLTLVLLQGVSLELAVRGLPSVAVGLHNLMKANNVQ